MILYSFAKVIKPWVKVFYFRRRLKDFIDQKTEVESQCQTNEQAKDNERIGEGRQPNANFSKMWTHLQGLDRRMRKQTRIYNWTWNWKDPKVCQSKLNMSTASTVCKNNLGQIHGSITCMLLRKCIDAKSALFLAQNAQIMKKTVMGWPNDKPTWSMQVTKNKFYIFI